MPPPALEEAASSKRIKSFREKQTLKLLRDVINKEVGRKNFQNQFCPLFSNEIFPSDLSSFVIQFHFPVNAKGLKAFGRFRWNDSRSNRKTRRASFTNSFWVNQSFTKLENLWFEKRGYRPVGVRYPGRPFNGQRLLTQLIDTQVCGATQTSISHLHINEIIMTMVDLSLHLPIFSEVHSDVTEAVSLETVVGFGPFFEDDLKQDYYFFLHKLWAFNKWGSWLILIFLTFYHFIFSLVSFCFSVLLLLDQFLAFRRVHSLGILAEFVNSVFSEFLLVWSAYICSPDEYVHFKSIFTTFSHKKFKDLAPLSSLVNYCWWEVWGQSNILFYFFSRV